jgi:hypothetical protein
MSNSALRCVVTIACLAVTAGVSAQNAVRPSPLRLAERQDGGEVTRLTLDREAYEALRDADSVTLRDFPLDTVRRVDLEVTRFEVLAPDARIVAASASGEREIGRPDVVLLRGRVAGEAGSAVFLGLSPHGNNGYVTVGGATHIVSSGPAGKDLDTVIYDLAAVDPEKVAATPFVCGADLLEHPVLPAIEEQVRTGGTPAGGGCQAAEIAIETDYEFTELFEGDTDASSTYATALLGACAEIFVRDVGTNLQIVFLRVWETADDPWEETSAFGRFNEFRSYWNANMTGTLRDAVHFLSGIPLSGAGGLGYAPGLCVPEFDYALSAHLNGFFPYPLEDHHSDNWDVLVVSHELGHNFGAPHTHSMSPPVDCCGCNPQDCSDAHNGTIMSYCHICEGGVANILLIFHVRTVTEAIIPYLSGLDCLPGESGPVITSHPADASPCEGESVTFTARTSSAP